ncbi:hypothetical protein L210DRAFT_3509910 [Boletus edulis BED1]|uniref:Uncharacterized protein n=1 Tax=Boletus edulis BED1 TaxID=1328754 RepID=A0AAD4BE11_BOLED|nr:hypothetical protein L210DRAFT_3509910 [Boletus edulis BED1]
MESTLGMRIGVIVTIQACEWFPTFHFALAYAGVRFWLVWGKAHPTLVCRIKAALPVGLHRYIPDHEVLRRCVQFMEKEDWPSVTSEQLLIMDRREVRADDDVLDQSLEPAPPPSPPRERSVETPLDFIKRRVEKEGARREKASPEELLKWSNRQRHADCNRWTTKSKVYHWTKVAGVRTRTRVEKNQIEHIWDKTDDTEDRTDNQRKYSAVFDEWDICTEFDELEILSEPEDDPHPQSNLGSSSHSASTNPSTSHAHPPLPPPPTLDPDHNAQGIVLAHASGIDDEQVDVPQLDVLLYHRYGFILEALAAAIREGSVTPVDDPLSLDAVAQVLMEKNAVSSTSCQDAACQAVTLIKRGLPIPDLYWDLKNNKLRGRNPCYFMFLPLELNSVDSDTTLKGYTVNPTSSRYLRPWVVLFESSIAVTQCIRERWGPSLEDVISKACQTGFRIHLFLVKFKTDLPLRSYPIPMYSRREREGGFVPSHFDFHAYQKTVQSLLEVPRLRCAVLRGGILTRICSPYVDLDDVAAYGPSNDAIRYGSRWKGEDDNVVFIEDYVSEAEIELLCGHFHIDTSAESGRAGQSRTVSFFPTPDIWESSGIHTSSWSNSAEEKFRTLMGKLRPSVDPASPVPSPVPVKGKKEWRQNLRHHIRETKGFLGYVEQASSEFLTSLLL